MMRALAEAYANLGNHHGLEAAGTRILRRAESSITIELA